MEGITFDPTAFISSPFFWRALLLLIAMWTLKNAPTIFDNLRYVFDKMTEVLTRQAERQSQVDQVVVEALRQKLEKGDPYDVSFVVTLYESMLDDLRKRNRVLEDRLQAMTSLAIEKSDESARVVGLLNGTVSMFNTVAEQLTDSIRQLNEALHAALEKWNGRG